MNTHRYRVGQNVRANRAGLALTGRSAYRIVALLPPLGMVNQYRVRNAVEQHDRIMTERQLEAAAELVLAEETPSAPQLEEGPTPWPRARSVAIANPRNQRKPRH